MLEIVVANLKDALNAQKGGAKRIEIVSNPNEDGLTPQIEIVKEIINSISIPARVMIRDKNIFSGFSLNELKKMTDKVNQFKDIGVQGIVTGFLNANNEIDFKSLEIILKNKGDMKVTFHRAFDKVRDPQNSMEELINFCLVDRVLTSGKAKTAEEGIEVLKKINSLSKNKIIIIAGGSISAKNISKIKNETGINEFHVGTAVRNNKDYAEEINVNKVREIVEQAS